MTAKQRILGAMRRADVDYTPMVISWNETQKLHGRLSWGNERERLAYAERMGWDTVVRTGAFVTPREVTVRRTIEEYGGKKILRQTWETPAAVLREALNFTGDWDRSELGGDYLALSSDFRTPRYIEYPFNNAADIEALNYIFPENNPEDMKKIEDDYQTQRGLADGFGCPLFLYLDAGMDWITWLYPITEGVCRAVDEPQNIARILEIINDAKYKRLMRLLELGVDGVIRRGWYECTDIWSPELLRRFAWPALVREIETVHDAGKLFAYTIDTGVKHIAPDLAKMGIDCFNGLDPVRGDMTVAETRAAFPDACLWGGFSGPGHFGAESPDMAARAAEEAMAAYGGRGLILGMAASYRHYYPWENFLAAENVWKRLRQGGHYGRM